MSKKLSGCPSGRDCCDDPYIYTPEHKCSDELVCEGCYTSACRNCEKECICDL